MPSEDRLRTPPSLCSIMPRAHLMGGFFVEWFQKHFADPDNIEAKELRNLVWTPPAAPASLPGQCKAITIDISSRWDPSATDRRPAIIVSRNDWEVVHFGLDDRLQSAVSFDGAEYFAAAVRGSHTLFCLGGGPDGTATEILAAEVYRDMLQFGPAIRQRLNLMRFQAVSVGKLFELEEAKENYAVPVTVAYVAKESWKLLDYEPKIKTVDFRAYLP